VIALWPEAEDAQPDVPGIQVLPLAPANAIAFWLVVRSPGPLRAEGVVYGPFGLAVASLALEYRPDATALRQAAGQALARHLLSDADLAAIDDAVRMAVVRVFRAEFTPGRQAAPGTYRFEAQVEGRGECTGPLPQTSVTYQSLLSSSTDAESVELPGTDGGLAEVTGDSLLSPGDGHPTIVNDGNLPLNVQVQFGEAAASGAAGVADAYWAGMLGTSGSAPAGGSVALSIALPVARSVALHLRAAAGAAPIYGPIVLSVEGLP
jgi:hypothetical protein